MLRPTFTKDFSIVNEIDCTHSYSRKRNHSPSSSTNEQLPATTLEMGNVAVSNRNVHQQQQHLAPQNDFDITLRDSSGLNIVDMHHSSPTKFTTSNGDVISFRCVTLVKKLSILFLYMWIIQTVFSNLYFSSTNSCSILSNYFDLAKLLIFTHI